MEVNMNRKVFSIMGIGLVCLVLVVVMSSGRLLLAAAEWNGVSPVPELISYQGFLADSNGDPVADGSYPMDFAIYDTSSGGSAVWAESHGSVAVSGGFFAVMLGSGSCTSGCPLNVATFSGPSRYLQVSADTGSGMTTFPRQQLASAPYALQSEQAQVAPWDGLTGVPAGFADGIDDVGGAAYEHVITVSTAGGDYTSVTAALASITDNSSTNRYLVQVMPGVYTESDLVEVKEYVHLRGSGPNVTVITSSRTGGTPGNGSATVDLLDNGRLSDLTVRNTGTGAYGIALYSAQTTRTAVVENVVAEAIGAGGTGHYAAFWNDAEAVIRHSTLFAGGATGFGTGVNAAFGSVNISSGFPQALIENSILIGGSSNTLENCTDNSGTGFGMQLSNSTPLVRTSYICGGHRGIALYTNGNPQIQNSSVKVSSTGSAFLFEIAASGSISVANSGISYSGNKFTGAGTGLRCVHNYDLGTWAALSNGTTSGTACN
jgi:hypothetical protein